MYAYQHCVQHYSFMIIMTEPRGRTSLELWILPFSAIPAIQISHSCLNTIPLLLSAWNDIIITIKSETFASTKSRRSSPVLPPICSVFPSCTSTLTALPTLLQMHSPALPARYFLLWARIPLETSPLTCFRTSDSVHCMYEQYGYCIMLSCYDCQLTVVVSFYNWLATKRIVLVIFLHHADNHYLQMAARDPQPGSRPTGFLQHFHWWFRQLGRDDCYHHSCKCISIVNINVLVWF